MLLYMFRTLLCPSSGAFHHCTTEQRWRTQPTQNHTVTRGCMCSGGRLLMMDTAVSETCRATQIVIKFYDFKTDVHLVGFYSILWLMMHGTMNVKIVL
jgi:hypothetical protein